METLDSLASAVASLVTASDATYTDNAGEPRSTSTAATEVAVYDEDLAEATGTPSPVFGAYADAEAKLRSLNDLARSFSVLLASRDVNVGQIVIGRAAIETAARMRWGLAVEGDHRERAARWLRERLRTIEEVAKFGSDARSEMERQRLATQIIEGGRKAGLAVTGPPPAAIDLVWPLVSATESPLRIAGLDRETAMVLFYRNPSALTHGAPHGIASHAADPMSKPSSRTTGPAPIEETVMLTAGILNGYANANGALMTLYGWDASTWNLATARAAEQVSAALQIARA